jgi:hypothetical protein
MWPAYWSGGGWFESETQIQLNYGFNLNSTFAVPDAEDINALSKPFQDLPREEMFFKQLKRDGWQQTSATNFCKEANRAGRAVALALNSSLESDNFIDDYTVTADGNILLELGRADWANWSHRGDLLFAEAGKIFRLKAPANGPWNKLRAREVADLNASKFEKVIAPEWAKQWPLGQE